MSIQTEFANQLEALRACHPLPPVLLAEEGDERIEIALEALDALSCACRYVEYRTAALQNRSTAELSQLSDELARRMTYLLETVRTVEVDQEHETVQMRSDRPHRTAEGKSYYELLARPGSLYLCRYLKLPGTGRQKVSAQLTDEALTRLVADWSEAVRQDP